MSTVEFAHPSTARMSLAIYSKLGGCNGLDDAAFDAIQQQFPSAPDTAKADLNARFLTHMEERDFTLASIASACDKALRKV